MTPERATEILIAAGHDPAFFHDSSRFEFLQACKNGPTELMEAFLVMGMPMRSTADREPPIIKATEGKSWERIALLREKGVDLETRDIAGDTALHTAANWGHTELVQQLVREGATCDTINAKRWTPLTKAVSQGKSGMVDALLEAGASPSFGPSPKTSPLVFALKKHPHIFRRLLEAGAEADLRFENGETLLMWAAANGDLDAVTQLLARGAVDVPNASGWTAWKVASAGHHEEVAGALAGGGSPIEPLEEVELIAAAREGDLRRAQELLDASVNPSCRDRWGWSPLMLALSKKNDEMAELLLERGCDPAIITPSHTSALAMAARRGNVTWVKRLLEAGAPIDETEGRCDALIRASREGHAETVDLLLAAGASLDGTDDYDQSAVFLAASKGHGDIVRRLARAGADLEIANGRSTPLLIAVSFERVDAVRALVEAGANLEARAMFERTPLIQAVDKFRNTKPERAEIVKILLEGGADPDAIDEYGASAVNQARSSKNQPCIDVLEPWLTDRRVHEASSGPPGEQSTDWRRVVDATGREALRVWILRENIEAITALLDRGLDIGLANDGPRPPLQTALSLHDPTIATLLLDRGADPHLVDRIGTTTLMAAAGRGHEALVQRLLQAGLDVNATNIYNSTPLSRAAEGGHLETARILLEAGANVNMLRAGYTPLMRAALNGHQDVARLLLQRGAEPDVKTPRGETALELARKKEHQAVVDLLMEVSDPDIADERGRTPLFKAALRGDVRAVKQLLAREANPDHADRDGDTARDVARLRRSTAALLEVGYAPLGAERPPEPDPAARALLRGETPESIDVSGRDPWGFTPLHLAVLRGDAELMQRLLDEGADVHATTERGDTPWSIAVNTMNDAAQGTLRSAGAKIDVEAQVRFGGRMDDFARACAAGDLRTVGRMLASMDIPLHRVAPHRSPLSLAVRFEDVELLDLLLRMGADPEVGPQTPLMRAASRGALPLVDRLLEGGAELERKSGGRTAFAHAAIAGHAPVMERLLEAGARAHVDVDAIWSEEALRVLVDFAMARGLGELGASAFEKLCGKLNVPDEYRR